MYVIIWEFKIRSGAVREFENAYGSGGIWVALFRRGKGYIRSELLHNANDPDRYMTLDYWTSQEAYESFRKQYADEYNVIDLKCEALTIHEAQIATFTTV